MSAILRFGIAGIGNIGHLHATAIAAAENAELAAVSGRTAEHVEAAERKLGVPAYTDWRRLIDDPTIDVINVCTPSGTHMEIAVAAASAGKHVIVEKPLDITLARTDAIIRAAADANVKLACIFPARFKPGARRLKTAVDAGRLGRLALCDAYVKWHRSQEYYDTGGWRGTWELDGGGAMMNQSIHHVDLLYHIAGDVRSVMAYTATRAHTIETEDVVVASVTFADGALGVIEGSTAAWPGLPGRLEVSGSDGTVTLDDVVVSRWDLCDGTETERDAMLNEMKSDGSGSSDPMGIAASGHITQIKDFVAAVHEDRTPLIDGAEGRKAVEIVTAIYTSAKEKREVRLPVGGDG